MTTVLLLGLSLLTLFLVHRTYRIHKRLRAINKALLQGQMLLIHESDSFLQRIGLESLQSSINELIEAKRRQSLSERSHLEQIRATLGNIREAVLIVDEDNFVRLANDAFAQVLGRSLPTIGRRLESLVQGAEFLEHVRTIKQQGSGEHREVKVLIGKQSRWLEVTGTRLPEQDRDEGILTLFVLHDITAMKNLERMRTDFVANVSHELRTPVTIIKGYVDTLVDDRATLEAAEQDRFLQKIQRNVARLHELLEDLLMLSRLESSMEMIELKPLELSPMLNEMADNFSMRLQEGKQRIEVVMTASTDLVMADKLRIQQVLENLMENVVRHAKGFSVMKLIVEDLEGSVGCWVADDGQGMPQSEIPHIFERFYRVDKSRSRESGGTGLGLSIVKHIIHQHGGKVLAESVPGRGTRIGFILQTAAQPPKP